MHTHSNSVSGVRIIVMNNKSIVVSVLLKPNAGIKLLRKVWQTFYANMRCLADRGLIVYRYRTGMNEKQVHTCTCTKVI